jgi:acetylornithine deacetylase/succinyl-diaminopimelate desuccinylase-like protein
LAGGLALALAVGAVQAQSGSPSPGDLLKDPAVRAAIDAVKANEAQTIADQIRFCEIPAPSFKEELRGQELKRVFTQLGLQNVRVDKVGNVLGDYAGAAAHPHLVLAAHLDTVFPEGTDVKVKREGALLKGPGIGDDCRGLGVMVAIVREMKKANVKTPGSITFVANVGEEGLGDLRGVKELFKTTLKDQIDRFVSIDGTGVHVTNVAVGSHRYRVTLKGPGGHSFGAFGLANPMARWAARSPRSREFAPKSPRTTFNVGRTGGGTSSTRFRSGVDRGRHALVGSGVAGGSDTTFSGRRRWSRGTRAGQAGSDNVVKGTVGDRPAGSTPENRRSSAAASPRRRSWFTSNLGEDRPTRTFR